MELRSLGYRTDLMVLAATGRIRDRGSYLVVESPRNPHYYWGNLLVFRRPPAALDLATWCGLFERELGGRPGLRHVCFGWDGVDGDVGEVEPFLEAGFRLERCDVLTADRVRRTERCAEEALVRELEGDADWERLLRLQLDCNERIEEEAFRRFKLCQNADVRAALRQGAGRWYGAFLGERLVGALGILRKGPLGRFQDVQTHPDFRRRGICARLVHDSSRDAFAGLGVERLVIVADREGAAGRIYRSLGFEEREQQVGLCRPPSEDRDPG